MARSRPPVSLMRERKRREGETIEGIFFFLTRYLRVLVFYRPWRADAREREKRRDIWGLHLSPLNLSLAWLLSWVLRACQRASPTHLPFACKKKKCLTSSPNTSAVCLQKRDTLISFLGYTHARVGTSLYTHTHTYTRTCGYMRATRKFGFTCV
jgi:hypothetical protein